MPSAPADLDRRLTSFLQRFRDPEFARPVADKLGWGEEKVLGLLDMYLNEAHAGLAVVAPYLERARGKRILEVGSGVGVLSAFLKSEGHDITGLEPVGLGFDFFSVAARAVADATRDLGLPRIEKSVVDATSDEHGTFGLIFSVNVLEHIDHLDAAFARMAELLAPGGEMIHSCPNYLVPYEPHFGIPLVPFAPALTAKVFRAKVASNVPLWHSLNFIDYGTVQKLAKKYGLAPEFHTGLLHRALSRLDEDEEFAKRHPGVARSYRALQKVGVAGALARIPAWASTPMQFELRHA